MVLTCLNYWMHCQACHIPPHPTGHFPVFYRMHSLQILYDRSSKQFLTSEFLKSLPFIFLRILYFFIIPDELTLCAIKNDVVFHSA